MFVLMINIAASFNQLVRDGCMPLLGQPMLRLKIDVTASSNELFRDNRVPFLGRDVERRGSGLRGGEGEGWLLHRRR